MDNVAIGDYVIIHVGYALTKLDEGEAKKTLQLFHEMTKYSAPIQSFLPAE